jgi:hypothetical protein
MRICKIGKIGKIGKRDGGVMVLGCEVGMVWDG